MNRDKFSSGWNLPPGCFERDIPGNRPGDVEPQKCEKCDGSGDAPDGSACPACGGEGVVEE